jgi:prepilin-type N-terminal cleavage/methylation domain-containing protein
VKTRNRNKFNRAGFTLAEMSVAVAVMLLLGLIFFKVLNSGIILYAKNSAVNAAHEEGRQGINRMTRDIHAAIAVPELRDLPSSFTGAWTAAVVDPAPVSGVPPIAAGVSFQNIAGGPNYVWKDPNNDALIMIRDDTNVAAAGMRLIIPFYGLEEDITKVTATGSTNHKNIFIKSDQSTPQIDAPPVGGTYCITYYTDRVMYLVQNGQYIADSQGPWRLVSGTNYVLWKSSDGAVQRYRYENGELHLYKQRYNGSSVFWEDQAVVARFISSPKPFYIPLNSVGGVNNRYVGVKLTARDPKTSNRSFISSATLLDTQIDYRSRIALYQ